MSYCVDRQKAFREIELVAILRAGQREARSRLLLRDGSLQPTQTRPRTLKRKLRAPDTILEGTRWQKDQPSPSA